MTSPIVKNLTRKIQGDNSSSAPISSELPFCQVIGFSDPWFANRKFPIDMAGFAANVNFIASHPHQSMPYKVGYEEDYFLQSLNVSFNDLEPRSECCTQVYVWHTKTVSKKVLPSVKYSEPSNELLSDTNLLPLMKNLEDKGLVKVDSRRGQHIFTCTEVNGCDTSKGKS